MAEVPDSVAQLTPRFRITLETLAAARDLATAVEGTVVAARALLATIESGPVATREGTGENLGALAGTTAPPEPYEPPGDPTERPGRRAPWMPGFSNTAN